MRLGWAKRIRSDPPRHKILFAQLLVIDLSHFHICLQPCSLPSGVSLAASCVTQRSVQLTLCYCLSIFLTPIYLAKGRSYCLLCQSPFTHVHLMTSQSKSIQLNKSKYPRCVRVVIICRLDDQVFRIQFHL